MKTLTIVVILSLSGCAFAPPDAYPIFRLPNDVEANALAHMTSQNKAFGAGIDISSIQSQLMSQRQWYLQLAENSQKGVYNQSDWALGGATLGTLGGLAKSVPVAVAGALIGGGSSMIASRYSLMGQTTTYLKAAEKVACVWAVVNAYTAAKPAGTELHRFWDDADRSVTKGVSFATLQIEADVRTTLLTFNPTQPDTQTLVTLSKNYAKLKQLEVNKIIKLEHELKPTSVTISNNREVAEQQGTLAAHQSVLADYKSAMKAAAKAGNSEDKRVANIAVNALSNTIDAQTRTAKKPDTTGQLNEHSPVPLQKNISFNLLSTTAEDAARDLAGVQEKATNTEIAFCIATGKPVSGTSL